MDPKVKRAMPMTSEPTTPDSQAEDQPRERAGLAQLQGEGTGGFSHRAANDQHLTSSRHDNESERLGGIPFLVLMKFLLPIAILVAATAGYLALKASKPAPRKPVIVEKTWPVDATTARKESITPTLTLYGKTVANRAVELRALVSGKITNTGPGLKEGALVKEGEMLVEIDSFDYQGALTEAGANLKEAEARKAELEAAIDLEKRNLTYAEEQLTLAIRDYERVAELSKKGTVTKKLADDRKVIVSQREQSVSTSRTNIRLQEARLTQQVAVIERLEWKRAQAQRRLAETTLTAPFNAYVSAVNAELGKTVSVNDQIARLIDRNAIDVRFTLSDAQYGRIIAEATNGRASLIGREVTLEWKVGETPVQYKARVTRIGAEIASDSGGVEIYARVENPAEPTPLRTGAFVEVTIKDRSYQDVFRLPQTALYSGDLIYIIKDERLVPLKVTIVNATGQDILVEGDIPDGATVLTTKLTLAGEGVKVKVRGSEESTPAAKTKDKTATRLKDQKTKAEETARDRAAKGL